MSFDHLPANIEEGVRTCAAAWHVSHDDAVIRLLETGLTVLQPELAAPPTADPGESRKAREAARQTRLSVLSRTPPERANEVFGAFANVPGFQESIDAVIAGRAQRYGFVE